MKFDNKKSKNENNGEKIKAPVHKRKKDGKKKQASKKEVREKLSQLQNEAIESLENAPKKSKEEKKKAFNAKKDAKFDKKSNKKSNQKHEQRKCAEKR